MNNDIKKILKNTILEVLNEERQVQLNEFNPKTGRFADEGLSSEQKKITSEKISKFGKYQKFIAHEAKDIDVAEDICNIVENASKYILNETDDWFDEISVKRNLKEINKKVIVASASEIRNNSRARSAKLRIASKINDN